MGKGRFLSTLIVSLLLVGLVAGPVNAAKPQPSASAGLADRSCDLLVSYSWSKFHGKNFTANVGLYERTTGGDQLISAETFTGQIGRTGSVGFIVSLSADVYPGGRTLVALGDLTDSSSSQVAGSSAESATISSTCG